MNRRWTLLAAALAVALSVPQAAVAAIQRRADRLRAPRTAAGRRGRRRLRELKADCRGRAYASSATPTVTVALVSSTDGRAMLDSDASSPRRRGSSSSSPRTARPSASTATTSRAVVTQTLDSAHGRLRRPRRPGRRRRPRLRRPGRDEPRRGPGRRLRRRRHHRRRPRSPRRQVVARPGPRQTALRGHGQGPPGHGGDADARRPLGRRLYDPAIVHATDPAGTRPVWQFEVTNGSDVRETVLVGTGRGEVALHFNDAPGARPARLRQRQRRPRPAREDDVPVCPLRRASEGEGAPRPVADVNAGLRQPRRHVRGLRRPRRHRPHRPDRRHGRGAEAAAGHRPLVLRRRASAPTRTPSGTAPRWSSATGYAAADDVVGHELTHGYVERTVGPVRAPPERSDQRVGRRHHRRDRRPPQPRLARRRRRLDARRGPAGTRRPSRSLQGPDRFYGPSRTG